MNNTPERSDNADLPRPRTDTFYDIYQQPEELPSLQYKNAGHTAPIHTQEFRIPKQPENSDSFRTQKLEIPPQPDVYANFQNEAPDNDFSYGAYEKYDHVAQKTSSQNHKKKNKKPKKTAESSHKKSQKKQDSEKHSQKTSSHKHSHGGGLLKKLARKLIWKVISFCLTIFIIYSAISILLIRQLEKLPDGQRSVTSGTLDRSYVRSVLLIGTDARDVGAERGRSDTMLLFSLNSRTQQIYLTSFMRDAYVDIPGYGYNKLNAAYSYGGAELLMDTLEQNYQISIDDYCVVGFMGFAGIIDAFGGVDVTLSDEEAQAMNVILQSEVNELAGDDPLSDFIENGGTYLLNGKQALSYARIRYVGNADFERTSRQREVMTQLLENAKTKAVTAVPKLITSAMPHLGTNMSDTEMYLLSLRVPLSVGYDITQVQIPADGTYSPADIDGQSVLQVDFDANMQILKHTVYSSPEASAGQ
ncbi:MAG: LCP family protein [Oscillospiraceae bacterium]|nr:LCP family protein [Oscillospiraceae bacterium]